MLKNVVHYCTNELLSSGLVGNQTWWLRGILNPLPIILHPLNVIEFFYKLFSIRGIVAFWLSRENVTPRKYLAIRALETKSWDLGQEAIVQYA